MSRYTDPAVIVAAADIDATLRRMQRRIEEIGQPASGIVVVRVSTSTEARIAQWMRARGLTNRGEALRRILAAGLEAR